MTVLQLDPFDMSPEDDPLNPRMRQGEAGDLMAQVGVEAPIVPPPPVEPPPALARQQAEAQRVGDAYRAQTPPDPRAFGLSAYVADGERAPAQSAPAPQQQSGQWPPAGGVPEVGAPGMGDPRVRERLAGLLRARQQPQPAPEPTAAPVPDAAPAAPQVVATVAPQAAPQAAAGPAAGPPGEPDYTGADVSDAVRRPLHAIGSALRAAAGSQPTAFRSERDALEARTARTRQADQRSSESEAQRGLAERRMALAERGADAQEGMARERQDTARQRLEMDRGRTDTQTALAERQAQTAAQRAEVGMALSRAQIGRLETDAEREAAALDPGSQPSRVAQSSLRLALQGYPPEARERIEAEMGRVDELSQRQIDQVMRGLPSMFRDLTNRRGGPRRSGGGGGRRAPAGGAGSVSPEAQGTADDPLVREAVRLGMDEAVALDMASDTRGGRTSGRGRLQTMITRESAARGRLAGHAVIAGWERDPSAATLLTANESRDLNRVTVADREFSANITELESLLGSIGADERVSGRFRTGSERYYEIQHRLDVIRNQMRQISNMGNSLGAQDEIRHSVPNLDDNVTAGAILRNVRAAYRAKNDYVTALLGNYGYARRAGDAHGGGHGGGGARRSGGGGAAAPRQQADTVRVRHPDGRTGTIPRANLARAQQSGFAEVE